AGVPCSFSADLCGRLETKVANPIRDTDIYAKWLSGARRVHGPVRGASPTGNDLVKRTSLMIACVAWLACGFGAAAFAQQPASARKSAAATPRAPLDVDWSGVS